MALNRSQLRTKIREKLREFYAKDTVATGGIDATATTLPVTSPSQYKAGDLLQIEDEQLTVTAIDIAASELTVVRAANETTAAAHIATTAIKIIPEITDRMVNDAVNEAIADTKIDPDTGVGIWIYGSNTSLSTLTSTREYTKPAAIEEISLIEILDDNSNYQVTSRWRLVGNTIVFHSDFADAGKTIRISGIAYQDLLSSDSGNLDISDNQAMFVIYKAAAYLVESRLPARIKATLYSASVNERAGQPNDMQLLARFLNNEAIRIKRREGKPFPTIFAQRMKR